MKRFFIITLSLLQVLFLKAQTEVTAYQPGITDEGITYFLPVTQVRVFVTAKKVHHEPGEFCEYAERYLRLKNVPQTAYDEWQITDIKLYTYGVADKSKAYTIKVKTKTSAPLVSLTPDGRLLTVNSQSTEKEVELPTPSVVIEKIEKINPQDYKTEEILSAGSTSKMAELTANEIYDIRDNRNMLAKGQADFMPKDGEQLKIMLSNLDEQEEALLQLFRGTTTTETHTFALDINPSENVKKQQLFRFSKYLGMTDSDDPAGTPFYYSIEDLNTLPAITADVNTKPKKEAEDLRYMIAGMARVSVFTDEKTYVSASLPMAQFGRVEHLGGELFNKKYTTHVKLSPTTGAIEKIDAKSPD